jgi:hypothetical protein
MFGLLEDAGDRYEILPTYHALAETIGALGRSPVTARAAVSGDGPTATLRLEAHNASKRVQKVRFWPFGLVDALGADGNLDWSGTLDPGAKHTVEAALRPSKAARGRYAVGLVVLADDGTSALALTYAGPFTSTGKQPQPLSKDEPHEVGISEEIAAPEPAGLDDQPSEPFEAVPREP